MLRDDGWFDWAIREPGPPDRILSAFRLPLTVITFHSLEGYIGAYKAYEDPARFPTAWHDTNPKVGVILQHYSFFAHLQHGNAANVLGPGSEMEGRAGEPMTENQLRNNIRIIRDVNEYLVRHGRDPLTRDSRALAVGMKRGLVEHGEMGYTACPSGRYAPLWAALAAPPPTPEDEMGMTDDEKLALYAGSEQMETRPSRAARLEYANARIAESAAGVAPSLAEIAAAGHSTPVGGGLKPGTEFTAVVK